MIKGRKRKVRERAEKRTNTSNKEKDRSESKDEIKNGRLSVGTEGIRKERMEAPKEIGKE